MMDRAKAKTSKWIWIALVCGFVAVAGVVFYIVQPLFTGAEPADQQGVDNGDVALAYAKSALARGDFPRARGIAEQVLESRPESSEALLVAGEAATRMGDMAAAVGHYLAVPRQSGESYAVSRRAAGNVLLAEARLSAAEEAFREALQADPDHPLTHHRLALILGLQGRVWESLPHHLASLADDQIDLESLLVLAAGGERTIANKELMDQALEVSPDDPALWMGRARVALGDGDVQKATDLINQVLQRAPQLVEAHAVLGEIVVGSDDPQRVRQWLENLPPAAGQHPDVLFQQGVWSAKAGDPAGAARCFWEALKLVPISQQSSYRLAQQLVALDRAEDARQLLDWADNLDKLRQLLDLIYGNRQLDQPDQKMSEILVRAAELTESMGRLREAWAWYRAAMNFAPGDLEIRKQLMRLSRNGAASAPLVMDDFIPTRHLDLSSLPMPDWEGLSRPATVVVNDEFIVPRFKDVAAAAQIDFTYENADNPEVEGLMIYQQNGGAVVALDYDVDGWPDLFLSQGGDWPPDDRRTQYRDRLFRNLGNGQFADVTDHTGLGDQRFSQGAAAGDYDNDGYPDLYLCNIGGNRLYRNQGDGTFAEVSDLAGVVGNDWSTSCLVADLSGDGLPDIYVVNYLEGQEPLETVCFHQGRRRACSPLNFPGGQDRYFVNLGDGRFEDATTTAGFEIPDGKGLGVVAVDLDGQGRKSIYVSNDATANFLFVPDPDQPGRFVDRALLSGVAYDQDGQAQGSMGIAVGDLNGDLLFDLFVTNFYNETNTIYCRQPDSFFENVSRRYGMAGQSMKMLAFGTEFIDYDLDSYPDLVVVNGHVDDFRYKNETFWMEPQLFRNTRSGNLQQVDGQRIGPYFQEKFLGRALATLDWNRDGKLDFAVMHLQMPVALLNNETETPHHFLSLQLRGVESERMAYGATVSVTGQDRTTVHQLVAGSGYQCCNQALLNVGLGADTSVRKLVVRWPSGLEQQFTDVAADREYLLVENAAELTVMPRE